MRALVLAAVLGTLSYSHTSEAKKPPTEFARAIHKGQWLSALGLNVTAGLAFGGDTVFQATYADGSTSSMQAGDGLSLLGGLTFTPIWIGDRLGLGLGAEAGYKYRANRADNGTAELTRFPLLVTARGLFALGANWHLLAALGAQADLGTQIAGDGIAANLDVKAKDSLGFVMEGGVLLGAPQSFGAEITGRYTMQSYQNAAQPTLYADASNGSVNFRLHYFF